MSDPKHVRRPQNDAKGGPNPGATGAAQGCQACDVPLGAGAKFCPQCGVKLAKPREEAAPPSAPPVEQPRAPEQSTDPAPPPAAHGPAPEAAPLVPAEPRPDAVPEPAQVPCRCDCGQDLPADARFCFRCGEPVRQPRAQYRLVCVVNGDELTADMTGQELTIGKAADCDMVIADDGYVSRRHARVLQTDGGILLEDLQSSNGTFLRVKRPIALEPGDEILIGARIVRFEEAANATQKQGMPSS